MSWRQDNESTFMTKFTLMWLGIELRFMSDKSQDNTKIVILRRKDSEMVEIGCYGSNFENVPGYTKPIYL